MLRRRSNQKELLDLGQAFYSLNEYTHCQKVLFKINKLLGFFSHTKRVLKRFAPLSVLDVGCGGGLFILNLSEHFPSTQFTGCDISADAIQMAEEESKNYQRNNVSFDLQRQLKLKLPPNSVDLILATLVCHHIPDSELVGFLRDTLEISRKGVVINDLHRHIIPYLFYKLFSPLFGNRLINHDGLISIRRGFTRKEWRVLLEQSKIEHFTIRWRFPFCWSVILWKK